MAFKGIDHVVVRVADLDAAITSYNRILGMEPRRASSAELKADQAFYHFDNGTFLELIQPTDETSPLAGPLAKRGDGVHSVAFDLDDQKATAEQLSAAGLRVIGNSFVHPGDANGLMIQLYETGN